MRLRPTHNDLNEFCSMFHSSYSVNFAHPFHSLAEPTRSLHPIQVLPLMQKPPTPYRPPASCRTPCPKQVVHSTRFVFSPPIPPSSVHPPRSTSPHPVQSPSSYADPLSHCSPLNPPHSSIPFSMFTQMGIDLLSMLYWILTLMLDEDLTPHAVKNFDQHVV